MRDERIMLWGTEIQVDFIDKRGKLYAPGSELILPCTENLHEKAKKKGYMIAGSVDAHAPDDPEFKLYPEHCVKGTPGYLQMPEIRRADTIYVPMDALNKKQIDELANYHGPVYFEKNALSCKVNPNIKPYLEIMQPERIVEHGVLTDLCVDQAILYIAGELGYKMDVKMDAINALDKNNAEKCIENWKSIGVGLI